MTDELTPEQWEKAAEAYMRAATGEVCPWHDVPPFVQARFMAGLRRFDEYIREVGLHISTIPPSRGEGGE